jgi:hypothetical protein
MKISEIPKRAWVGQWIVLAGCLQAAEPPRPLMRDFIGINGHTVQFKPALYQPVCRLVRDYHPVNGATPITPGCSPPWPPGSALANLLANGLDDRPNNREDRSKDPRGSPGNFTPANLLANGLDDRPNNRGPRGKDPRGSPGNFAPANLLANGLDDRPNNREDQE